MYYYCLGRMAGTHVRCEYKSAISAAPPLLSRSRWDPQTAFLGLHHAGPSGLRSNRFGLLVCLRWGLSLVLVSLLEVLPGLSTSPKK